jgi:hypothetical protein
MLGDVYWSKFVRLRVCLQFLAGTKYALFTFLFLTCLFGNYEHWYHISLANQCRHKLKIPEEKLGLLVSWMMMMPELKLAS